MKDTDMPNTELLKKTLAHIESHPAEWNQRQWSCGTTACFAGHAIALSGIRFVQYDDEPSSDAVRAADLPPGLAEELGAKPDDEIYAPIVAAALLDIPEYLGFMGDRHLFDSSNSMDDLRNIVAELCAEREATAAS